MLTKLVPNALRTHGTSGPTNLLLSGENVQLNLSDDAAPQEVVLKLVHHAVAPERAKGFMLLKNSCDQLNVGNHSRSYWVSSDRPA